MRIASIAEFRKLFYTPDSAPRLATIRARIRRKDLPGGFIDNSHFYVDLDVFEAAIGKQTGQIPKKPRRE